MSKFIQNMIHLAKKEIDKEREGRFYGVIKYYNPSTKTADILIDDDDLYEDIPIQGTYKPKLEEDAMLVIGKSYRYITQNIGNSFYQNTEDEYLESIIYNLFYKHYGNYIANGEEKDALLSYYLVTDKKYIISQGSYNIEGQLFTFATQQEFLHDNDLLADGEYYLTIDINSAINIKQTLPDSDLGLLKITKSTDINGVVNFVYEDIRKTTKL